ncbi:MAG: type II toxin-antitoxin system RelE/ParE family toxin [Algicola sp.]|nr:type II toxin-antitoxin system RelE/ParE family toxin [Algicola sp.]
MRIFKTKNFDKFARKERVTDAQLIEAVIDIESGLFEGDLGGGVLKKRLAAIGRGKSGSYRSVVAFRCEDRTVFMFGYAKNTVKKSGKEITDEELKEYRAFAKVLFSINLDTLSANSKALIEVKTKASRKIDNGE